MKFIASLAAMVVSAAALVAGPNTALAQGDCKTLVKASPFGPDDQVGATNRVTAAVTKAAASEIQTGKVTSMAYNLCKLTQIRGRCASCKSLEAG